jgi:hypothetical protein
VRCTCPLLGVKREKKGGQLVGCRLPRNRLRSLTAVSFDLGYSQGQETSRLHVVQPTKFELVINLPTARAIGIVVPQSLLAEADDARGVASRPGARARRRSPAYALDAFQHRYSDWQQRRSGRNHSNQAPRVVLRATHVVALSYCAFADLKRLAVDLA